MLPLDCPLMRCLFSRPEQYQGQVCKCDGGMAPGLSINLMSRGHSNCAASLLLIGQVCHQPWPKMFLSSQGVKRASETPTSPGGSLGQHSCVQSSGTLSPDRRSFPWELIQPTGNGEQNQETKERLKHDLEKISFATLAYQMRGWLSLSSWRRCSESIVMRTVLETFPEQNTEGDQKSQARVISLFFNFFFSLRLKIM